MEFWFWIYGQMKPTLPRIKQTPSISMSNRSSTIWKNNRRCPFGSVPIKRVTKDDLIRHKLMPPPEDITFHTQFSKVYKIMLNQFTALTLIVHVIYLNNHGG